VLTEDRSGWGKKPIVPPGEGGFKEKMIQLKGKKATLVAKEIQVVQACNSLMGIGGTGRKKNLREKKGLVMQG